MGRLTEEQKSTIKARRASGESVAAIAKSFAVSVWTIYDVCGPSEKEKKKGGKEKKRSTGPASSSADKTRFTWQLINERERCAKIIETIDRLLEIMDDGIELPKSLQGPETTRSDT